MLFLYWCFAGNSCYMSAAFQCLRHTPGLQLRLVPDLMERVAAAAEAAKQPPSVDESSGAAAPANGIADASPAADGSGAPVQNEPMEEAVTEADGESNGDSSMPDAAAPENAADESEEKPDAQSAPPSAPGAAIAPVTRPARGELSDAVRALITDLYTGPSGGRGLSPALLVRTLRRFPAGADYFDGGQHDCQEVLQALIDLVHEDLNLAAPPDTPPQKACSSEEADSDAATGSADGDGAQQNAASGNGLPPLPPITSVGEAAKADAAWQTWSRRNCSPISDLFLGQLQSSVVCSKCGGRFTTYEPFWELSLPLAPKAGGTWSFLSRKPGGPLTLQDCLQAFTSEEKLEGDEAFDCEECKEKTSATKRLRVHRLPEALVLHIKRFRHRGSHTDKLTTNVTFPLRGLELTEHVSPESPHPPEQCCYDLYAVSNHTGNVGGGHYTAYCKVPTQEDPEAWWQFNDDAVSRMVAASAVSQHAYILFYARRRYKDPAAAAAAYAARTPVAAPGARHARSGSGGLFGGAFSRNEPKG